jgi:hypothetical protein
VILGRITDLEKRAEGLEIVVTHARCSSRADAFVWDIRTVHDVFVDYFPDNWSGLVKQLCFCLTAMSAALKRASIHSTIAHELLLLLPELYHSLMGISEQLSISLSAGRFDVDVAFDDIHKMYLVRQCLLVLK